MGLLDSLFGNPAYETALEVKRNLDRNFTYVTDRQKWGVESKVEQWDGDSPIEADCEEYSLAAALQMYRRRQPYAPLVVMTKGGEAHMIACGPEYCIDNIQPAPFRRSDAGLLYVLRRGQNVSGTDKARR